MGKSSLLDATRLWHGFNGSGEGWSFDQTYHRRAGQDPINFGDPRQVVDIAMAEEADPATMRNAIYARSAYRHEPDFNTSSITRSGDVLNAPRSLRMIDVESKVSDNYQRLVSAALDDIFVHAKADDTVQMIRDKNIGMVKDAVQKLFPHLELQGPGDPLSGGTFFFTKDGQAEFHYKNLSGGEKAGFDLILDLVIKRAAYNNTVFLIDEPELHLNTRVQATLLDVLLELTPANGQLWIATHSIGMLRRADQIERASPGSVAFLDFEGHDFNRPVTLTPTKPDRHFWSRSLDVALGDLAALVAPDQVVFCEGRPTGPVNPARAEFDARCYRQIFASELPRTEFVSVGNASAVAVDSIDLGRTIVALVSGIAVVRIVDRDGRSAQEIVELRASGSRVLSRRHLESYLLDKEVITALCFQAGKPELVPDATELLATAVAESSSRGNDSDDLKSAAGSFFVEVKKLLGLVNPGSNKDAFLADTLAPLISPNMDVYKELRMDMFGW